MVGLNGGTEILWLLAVATGSGHAYESKDSCKDNFNGDSDIASTANDKADSGLQTDKHTDDSRSVDDRQFVMCTPADTECIHHSAAV